MFALEAIAAKQGDCLLLHYGPAKRPRRILIDGGPAGVYTQFLRPRLLALKGNRDTLPLEMVIVSHIDDDHIHGVIDFTKHLHDEQENGADPLPFTPKTIWHNSFETLLEATHSAIQGELPQARAAAAGVVPAGVAGSSCLAAVAQSVKQGNDLRDLARKLGIPLNAGVRGALVMTPSAKPPVLRLDGGLTLTVLGPHRAEMDKLEEEWKQAKVSGKARQAAFAADYLNRTAENLSSIVLLAAFGAGKTKRRMLLTGDAGGDKIMDSLEAAGLLSTKKPMHVDLLKVQHHGSTHSADQRFFERITADRYVISGNGKHGNPHKNVLQWISTARAGAAYEMYLTYRKGEGLTATMNAFLKSESKKQPKHKYYVRADKDLSVTAVVES